MDPTPTSNRRSSTSSRRCRSASTTDTVDRPLPELRTERLLLRAWRHSDRAPFARLSADPEVMEHFVATLSREQSDALVDRIDRDMRERGYGLWASELLTERDLIGFVGLLDVPGSMPFAPAIEVGWRLAKPYWGRGLAYEGACASLRFAFTELDAPEVLAYTAVVNLRSRRLMERLGMTHDPGADFEHPAIDPGHVLRAHVLYRIRAENWRGPDGAVT